MSRLEQLIADLCPDGVEYLPLAQVLDYSQPTPYIVKSTYYSDSYSIPVLTAGASFILGYTGEKDGIYKASKDKPVIIFDDFTTSFHWVDFDFKVKSSALKILTEVEPRKTLLRFVFYSMQCITYQTSQHARQWIQTYSNIKIPIPPLPIQEEIVRILDTFTALEAELENELEARTKQYEYYRDALLNFDSKNSHEYVLGPTVPGNVEQKTIESLCYIQRGRVMSKDYLRDNAGTYPVYSSQTENEGVFGFIDTYDFDFESLTWTTDGANAGSVFYHKNKRFSITNVCGLLRVRSDELNIKYLYYYLKMVMKNYVNYGMGNPKLMSNMVGKIKVPLPPIAVQEQIVAILDRFEALVSDLKEGLPAEIALRRKQYEYYRDQLLTFQPLE